MTFKLQIVCITVGKVLDLRGTAKHQWSLKQNKKINKKITPLSCQPTIIPAHKTADSSITIKGVGRLLEIRADGAYCPLKTMMRPSYKSMLLRNVALM